MAKDSFIFSQTRGAVGNVVVRRNNGKTIVSAKPTTVANPRTYAQAEVRMRLAAVSKFYSPLATFLQQGVQGKNTQNSMSAFSSAAIALMKEQNLSAPKEAEWWPLPFRLSKGSVPPLAFDPSFSAGANTGIDFTSPVTSAITTVGDFARLLKSLCAIQADKFQLTIVVAYRQALASARFAFYPYVHRVFLDVSSTEAISSLSNERIEFFSIEAEETGFLTLIGTASYWPVGVALIISYWDGRQWVRSTSDLQISSDVLAELSANYDANVATFMDSASASDPAGRVYLDGYTRGTSEGGGSGVDWSLFPIKTYAGADVTATCTGVASTRVGSNVVLALTFSDSTTKTLTGNEKMNSFGKAFMADGGTKPTLTTEQQANAVYFDGDSDDYWDAYAAVASESKLSLSYFFGN